MKSEASSGFISFVTREKNIIALRLHVASHRSVCLSTRRPPTIGRKGTVEPGSPESSTSAVFSPFSPRAANTATTARPLVEGRMIIRPPSSDGRTRVLSAIRGLPRKRKLKVSTHLHCLISVTCWKTPAGCRAQCVVLGGGAAEKLRTCRQRKSWA